MDTRGGAGLVPDDDRAGTIEREPGRLLFSDPEGMGHELAVVTTSDAPLTAASLEVPAELALQGFEAVRALAHDPARSEALLADVLGRAGHIEEGLGLLAEALTLMNATGEGFHGAELHRLQGEFLLRQERTDVASREAEACFRRALALARTVPLTGHVARTKPSPAPRTSPRRCGSMRRGSKPGSEPVRRDFPGR